MPNRPTKKTTTVTKAKRKVAEKKTAASSRRARLAKIVLPINPNPSAYIPTHGGTFIDHDDIIKTLSVGIMNNLPVLLIGESGTGKTSAIRALAHQTHNGLRRVNLNGGTTADELVGRMLINDQGTYWVDGILTEAMRNGEFIVLDEINAALPEVLFVLQSVLDDDGYLVLTEKPDKEIVYKHPNFRIFATCNPPEYAGTKELNKALLSRFPICINADYPTAIKELEIIRHHLGNAVADSPLAEKLIGLANETRKNKDNGSTDFAINPRDVLNTLRLADLFEPIEALGLAFANKLDSADAKALKMMAKLHLPSDKPKVAKAITPIKSEDEFVIGNTYMMTADLHNTYTGLATDEPTKNAYRNATVKAVIQATGTVNAIKGEEFVVDGFFFENGSGIHPMDKENTGLRMATAITFTSGPNKNNSAVILHSDEIHSTMKNVCPKKDVIANINHLN